MTDKQIINSCKFQSRCIQYKDMYSNKHIKCPIVDFAIACRGENKCKYKTVYEQLKRKEEECEELKAVLKAIANRPCLNINNCNGNCLPHCKWNAHKLAQEALKELE